MDYEELLALDAASQQDLVTTFGFFGTLILVAVGFSLLFFVVALWRIFVKAGRPGWYAFVPIYNVVVALQIVKKPAWWVLLFFVPIIQYIVQTILALELAKAYGKSYSFALIFLLLIPVGYIIIAFDKSKYIYAATPVPPQPQPQPTNVQPPIV